MFRNSRIEHTLEAVRTDLIAVREQLASLNTHIDMWKTSEGRQNHAIAQIQTQMSSHSEGDAGVHAELRSDVRRLWWGIGIALTALAGAITAGTKILT